MNTVNYQDGALIFEEGAPGEGMYEVIRGSVAILANYHKEEERKLTEVKPGGVFGEMAVVESAPRSATAVAIGETELLLITAGELDTYLREHPDRILMLMRSLGTRVRALTRDYSEACECIAKAEEEEQYRKANLWKKFLHLAGFYERHKDSLTNTSTAEFRAPLYKLSGSRTTLYPEHAMIFREGDDSDCLYIVREGEIGIYSGYGLKTEQHLSTMTAGEYFGEMGMIEEVPRSATAVTMDKPAKLERIGKDELAAMMKDSPETVIDILRCLSARLRKLTVDYLTACRDAGSLLDTFRENKKMDAQAKALIAYYANSQIYTRIY